MKTIRIGKHDLQIKDYHCASDHTYLTKEEGQLWLYVNITDVCPASCPFCVNPGRKCGSSPFNIIRYQETLKAIHKHVYGVSFTGGEPMMEPILLDAAIGVTHEIMGDTIEIDMATSGIHLERIPDFKNLNYLDSIHISRHRINDADNRELMGRQVPSVKEIRALLERIDDPERVVFNCVLDRDGISTPEAMAAYLDMAADIGVSNTSFISMIPVNDYCREHYVDPESFRLEQDSRFRIWNHFHDHDYCSCSTGDYLGKQRKVRFYYRMPGKNRAPYVRQLVYEANNLLFAGFGGIKIELSFS